jgi:hypothetical protein
MIAIFRAIPSWILSMTSGEILGVMGYPLVFALLESLIALVGLAVAAIILPAALYRNQFVSQSLIIVMVLTVWAILMQFFGQAWDLWSPKRFLMGLIPALAAIGIVSVVIARNHQFRNRLDSFAERLFVLAIVYLILDSVFLILTITRNVF